MRQVYPSQLVEAQRDDRWHAGYLEAWRRDGDDWRAFVRYSTGVGMRHLEWVGATRVRLERPRANATVPAERSQR